MRNQRLRVHFYRNFALDMDESQYVAATCWFVESHVKFALYNTQGRELC